MLSSTWRVDTAAIGIIEAAFNEKGGALEGAMKCEYMTDPAHHSVRQHEIALWFDDAVHNPFRSDEITSWVAVDDDESIVEDGRFKGMFEGRAVVCDAQRGLTMEGARRAVMCLNKERLKYV